MAKNRLKAIQAVKQDTPLEYRFWREDYSRYYPVDMVTKASQNRINGILRRHATSYIVVDGIWLDYFLEED